MAAFLIGQPDPRFEPPPQQVSTAATHRAGLNRLARYGIRPEPQLDQTGTRGTRRDRARSASTLRGHLGASVHALDDRIRVNGGQQHIMGAPLIFALCSSSGASSKRHAWVDTAPAHAAAYLRHHDARRRRGSSRCADRRPAHRPAHNHALTTGRARTSTAIPTTSSPPTWPLEHDRRARPAAPSCRKSDVRRVEPTCATLRARCSCGLALLRSSCAKGPLAKINPPRLPRLR
jgi:hypothetical protein